MANPRSLSELLKKGGTRLSLLQAASADRAQILAQVRAALPAKLAANVTTASVANGLLTVGVVGGAWATRVRYKTDVLRTTVTQTSGTRIDAVRVKVVPPS